MLDALIKLSRKCDQLLKERDEARNENRRYALDIAARTTGNQCGGMGSQIALEAAKAIEAYLNGGSQGNV